MGRGYAPPPRVVLACSGLDHAKRGFESFARQCFDALRDDPRIELHLVKGSGTSSLRERPVTGLTRDSIILRTLGRALRREPFRLEQVTFGFSVQAELLRCDPDVVYFSEWYTGVVLANLRRATRRKHRLVFCNGAGVERGFEPFDMVQQLTPFALEHVIALGADPSRQRLLPLGFAIPPVAEALRPTARNALRRRLGLPVDRLVLLSVAALNRDPKRIDYLIDEVARMPAPRPYLLLAGQAEEDTPSLRELARERLGETGHSIRTVSMSEVSDLYRASDLFVLASLGESFGRVLVEAMAHGLRCIAHDYPIARAVLGDFGLFADLSHSGELASLLSHPPPDTDGPTARHRWVYERFSWDSLRDDYVAMLSEAAQRGRSLTRRAGTPA